ncbi:hypothetical protein [Mycobacterium sp. DL99]|uniref:hypothetical protein n=1 Tax=Mycobacterium sp. DL99 TaxID=2528957 RepID=UPI002570E85B|nr:hypothetical protein [Mycobacterium sp. DL99]
MKGTMTHTALLLAAGATAVAVAVVPTAEAAPSKDPAQTAQSCLTLGGTQNECQSPGDAQIYDAPPQVDYYPYAGGGT